MKLDAKFYGEIRKAKDDSIVPEDQWMVFLVKDEAFLPTLIFYHETCKLMGADAQHLAAVERTIERAKLWRRENGHLIKVPDAAGEKLLDQGA